MTAIAMKKTGLPVAACLFDLDGTLSDSIPLILATTRAAWAELGVEVEDSYILSQIGAPLADTGRDRLGPERGDEFVQAYRRHFAARSAAYDLRPFPGIPELLANLRERGIKLSLCTSKRRNAAEENLVTLGIDQLLDAVVTADSTENHKPRPEPALLAAELLAVEAERCVFIGDSCHDINCGRAARMLTIGVTWGAATREELLTASPDYIVDFVEEMGRLLLSLI